MKSAFATLNARCGTYRGRGWNHEGQAFTGTFELASLLGGKGFSIRYSALGVDGTLYHREESTIAPCLDEKIMLWNFNTNTPGMLAHELRSSDAKEGAALSLLFGFGQSANGQTFREEIALDLWEDGDLSYTYSWGLPGGEFKERSGLRMRRVPGGQPDLNHCHIQVKEMAPARAFYENYFQFREKLVCDEKEIFLENEKGFVLGLEEVENPEALPAWFHFGFRLGTEKDLWDLQGRMREEGAPILRELKDFGDTLNFYCKDPAGNKIEVYFNR